MNPLYLDVEIFFRETLDYSYLNAWYLGVVRRLYDSLAAWDIEAVAGLLRDEVVFHVSGTAANAGDHRGREGVFAFLEQAARLTGDTLRIRLHDVLVGDEHAAAVATYRVTCPGRAPLEKSWSTSCVSRKGVYSRELVPPQDPVRGGPVLGTMRRGKKWR
jgi:ketosteroid isomerase-like protein